MKWMYDMDDTFMKKNFFHLAATTLRYTFHCSNISSSQAFFNCFWSLKYEFLSEMNKDSSTDKVV